MGQKLLTNTRYKKPPTAAKDGKNGTIEIRICDKLALSLQKVQNIQLELFNT
jgi:hypothetical protein